MPESRMEGVFPILVTPFDEQLRVDEESLRRLVEFNLEAAVHGLGVALGSEIFRLTEAERLQVTRIVVDQARGRVPVVINTGAQGTELAVHYSRTAEDAGADALMVSRPFRRNYRAFGIRSISESRSKSKSTQSSLLRWRRYLEFS
jgi:4-hydroxy-tetrahydrodipicolinate synthase